MEAISSQADNKERCVFPSNQIEKMGIHIPEPSPPPTKCKYCGKTLYYEGLVFNGKFIMWHKDFPQRCNCEKAVAFWKKYDAEQEKAKKEEELAEKRKKQKERIERLIKRSGIKKRFLSRTFETFKVNKQNKSAFNVAKKYADEFEVYASRGQGIYFEGTYGTGKTHLAVAIAMQLLSKGVPVICKTSIDLFADIKSSYDDNFISEKDVLDVYKNVDLLIIDDLGKEQCTLWTMPILYSILNDRYENLKPTIITTNYNEEMLTKRLTPKDSDSSNIEAIISRLRECTDVVTMAWEDYRSCNNE